MRSSPYPGTLLLLSAAAGLLVSPALGQPPSTAPAMPIPTLAARTNSAGKRITRGGTATNRYQQDTRAMSVSAAVSFFNPPPADYDVQCFFIAREERGAGLWIFDAASETSRAKASQFEFTSEPISGTARTWTSLPFSGTFSATTTNGEGVQGSFSGQANSSTEVRGSKIEGWIVRVVSGGKVLRTESNQPRLRELAASNAKALDAAATHIKPALR